MADAETKREVDRFAVELPDTISELIAPITLASYQLGVINGLQRAAAELRSRAGDAFMQRYDDQAIELRTLGDAMLRLMELAKTEYANDYEHARHEAWCKVETLDEQWWAAKEAAEEAKSDGKSEAARRGDRENE